MSPARKAQVEAAQAAAAAVLADTEETPLGYMLRVMRDRTADKKRRDAMAVAAAAFIHPKLQAIEHTGDPDKPVHHASTVEFVVVDADQSLYPEEACATAKGRPL